MSPNGDVIASRPHLGGKVIHHDVLGTPGNTVLFMVRDTREVADTFYTGETIFEWVPETDALEERWTAFDFLSPTVDVGPRTRNSDWLHSNSLSYSPSGDILMSLMFLDQIISIAPDYQSLNWRLGGVGNTFTLGEGAVFSGQHTAKELDGGRVLMFDNRHVPVDSMLYSRALELELNLTDSTATKVWEFRAPNDNYSKIISSARRLANGNTMVTFGAGDGLVGSVGPIEVYEVTRGGDIVWNLVIEGAGSVYRATPFGHLFGEVPVPDDE